MIDQFREKYDTESSLSILELCDAFDVPKSSYYAARSRPESKRAKEEKLIVAEMRLIHNDRHTRCYGSPRMTCELNERGVACSENRCARLMNENQISASQGASFRPKTTLSDPNSKPAPNLLKDAPEPSAPGEVYVSDITYVATREGWLYLAVVIDLYTRMVVGWKLADHMRTSLVTDAITRATTKVSPALGAVFHSDRGCQYTARDLRKLLAMLGITQSMSAKGNCYDNAKSESFFSTIKREAFPDGCCFDTKDEARRAIFDFLEAFYNSRRRHSSLGNVSPEEYLQSYFTNTKTNLN